jgi:hypothetical protein
MYNPITHILPKVFKPVAIANVTNTAPQLPCSFYSQTLFQLPYPLGGVISSPDLFTYLRLVLFYYNINTLQTQALGELYLVLDKYFPRYFSYLHLSS